MSANASDSALEQWLTQSQAALLSVRRALGQLIQDALLGDGIRELEGDPALLSAPLGDWRWRTTPLLHMPQRTPWWLVQIQRTGAYIGLGMGDDDALFDSFTQTRERWALLPLYALAGDRAIVELLYRGTLAHWLRTMPLRLQTPEIRGGALLDWTNDQDARALPWRLSPLAFFYAYGALLAAAASSTTFLERWGGRRGSLLAALDMLLEHVESVLGRETAAAAAGTLLAADGLLAALRRADVDDDVLERYARICDLSRLIRPADLPAPQTTGQWRGLIVLAGSGANPGLRACLAQGLADAVAAPEAPQRLSVAAGAFRALTDDQWRLIRSSARDQALPETLLWSAALSIAAYARAARSSRMSDLLRRRDTTAVEYLAGIEQASPIDLLFGPTSDLSQTARRQISQFRGLIAQEDVRICLELRAARLAESVEATGAEREL